MNQREYNALSRLRWAIKRGTEDDRRTAAIDYCWARGYNPHFRYAVWPKFQPFDHDWNRPLDIEVYSETEWQRLVRRVAAEQHS